MGSGQSKRKLKIAIIFMPINEIRPPVSLNSLASSGDLVMDEISRRIARSHDVVAYCACGKGQRKVEQFDGVEYRRMSTWLDRQLLHRQKIRRLIDLAGSRNGPQPLFNSSLWYRHFIGAGHRGSLAARLRYRPYHEHLSVRPACPSAVAKDTDRPAHALSMARAARRDVIERRINAADLVLGVSDFIAAGVRQRFPSLAQRCSHVYNGADIALFARPPGVQPKPKKLLFVGRLAPEKGVHVLLDAFHIVLAQHPDAHLELIGPEIRCSPGGALPQL